MTKPMKTNFDKVVEFNRKAGFDKSVSHCMRLVKEEYEEVVEAFKKWDEEQLAKELIDLLYVTYGMLYFMGIDADKLFDIVHENNLTKVVKGVIINSEGKVEKPEWYRPIDMSEVIEHVKL